MSLWALFWIFFRVGCTSFGGFMVIVAVVQNAIVDRRKLLTQQDMLDGISLASILPGTMAVNVIAYVGYRLRGPAGAFVSAFAAVLPAFAFILALGLAYFRWGELPAVSKVFMGFVPAVTATIVAAAWNMGRASVTGVREAVIALLSAVALHSIGGFFSTLGIVCVAAVAGWFWFGRPSGVAVPKLSAGRRRKKKRRDSVAKINLVVLTAALPGSVAPFTSFDPSLLLKIFFTFAGMSLLLFGGHYVFIPIVQQSVVEGHGWVTQQEFVDAVALSQITPGPLMVSAAFIGLKVAGFAGAIAATVGVFTPSAVLMVVCTGLFHRIKESPMVQAVLRGVRPAVVGMIAAAVLIVGQTIAPTWISAVIFGASLISLLYFRVNAVWIIPVAGTAGYLVY